MINSTYN